MRRENDLRQLLMQRRKNKPEITTRSGVGLPLRKSRKT
jgi:hypothetical protein